MSITKEEARKIIHSHGCQGRYSGRERTFFVRGKKASKAVLEIVKKHPSFHVQTIHEH